MATIKNRSEKRAPRVARRSIRVVFTLAGCPAPRRQCDGSLLVPVWTPDYGWELSDWGESVVRPISRARCKDGDDCDAMHLEEHEEWRSAKTPAARNRVIQRQLAEEAARRQRRQRRAA